MSVLIKNMKMPKSCYECKLDLRTDICSAFCNWEIEHPYTIMAIDRLPDCPLVEVPDLRDVNACLKTLCFMLEQYSLPDEENNVTKFETTQDMAKYFKLMADMCFKVSEFE